MKRSRTVYSSMDGMDGSNKSELNNIEDVAFPSDESLTLFLTSDVLSKSNRLYYKCKKVNAGSSASGSTYEATDSESDVSSSYSCGDIFEVMGTKKNRDDRMLEIERNSQIISSDSEDCDIYDSDGDVSLLKFNEIFNNPKRNDFELVNTFNLLEVSALAV